MTVRKMIAGALSGFLSAFVVDLQAWSKSNQPFDWMLALKRWVAGAVAGIAAVVGIAGVDQ